MCWICTLGLCLLWKCFSLWQICWIILENSCVVLTNGSWANVILKNGLSMHWTRDEIFLNEKMRWHIHPLRSLKILRPCDVFGCFPYGSLAKVFKESIFPICFLPQGNLVRVIFLPLTTWPSDWVKLYT